MGYRTSGGVRSEDINGSVRGPEATYRENVQTPGLTSRITRSEVDMLEEMGACKTESGGGWKKAERR